MTEPRHRTVRVLDELTRIVLGIAGTSLAVMALVQAWQVFARYVMNDSPGWTEPLALLLMSVLVMFGAAVAVRRETHFAFTSLQDSLPGSGRRWARTISRLIAAASGAAMMFYGGTLMIDDWPVAMAGAPLPSGLRFAGLAFGGALILLFSIERLLTGDYVAPSTNTAED